MKKLLLVSMCAFGLLQSAQENKSKRLLKNDQTFSIGCMDTVQGERRAFQGATLYQPIVTRQVEPACAYHALYNALVVGNYGAGRVGFFNIVDEDSRNFLFGTPESLWKQFIIKQDANNTTGNWVETWAYEALIKKYPLTHFTLFDSEQHFLNTEHLHHNESVEDRKAFWDQIRKDAACHPRYTHYFFLNNKNAMAGEYNFNSHWIGVVFHKDLENRHHYYVMDSENKYQLESPLIERIVEGVETDHCFIPDQAADEELLKRTLENGDDRQVMQAVEALQKNDAQLALAFAAQEAEEERKRLEAFAADEAFVRLLMENPDADLPTIKAPEYLPETVSPEQSTRLLSDIPCLKEPRKSFRAEKITQQPAGAPDRSESDDKDLVD